MTKNMSQVTLSTDASDEKDFGIAGDEGYFQGGVILM